MRNKGNLADYRTTTEAGKRLRLTARRIRQLIASGELMAWRVGKGQYLVAEQDLQRLLQPVTWKDDE